MACSRRTATRSSSASSIVTRYRELWDALTGTELIDDSERWRVDDRIRRLNALGFDVDELAITTDIDGTSIQIQPKVVDSGHHSRRLLRLTGLDVRENQARRLLNDLDAFTASTGRQGEDEEIVAHDWLTQVYEPVTRRVPRSLVSKLEPAEVFHEVLEHRWYMAERAQHDIPIEDAIDDYVRSVLPGKPDEVAVLGVDTPELPVIADRGPAPRIEEEPHPSSEDHHDRPAARSRRPQPERHSPTRARCTRPHPSFPRTPCTAAPAPCSATRAPPSQQPPAAPPHAFPPPVPAAGFGAQPIPGQQPGYGRPRATATASHRPTANSNSRTDSRRAMASNSRPAAESLRRLHAGAGLRRRAADVPRVDRLRRAELRPGRRPSVSVPSP